MNKILHESTFFYDSKTLSSFILLAHYYKFDKFLIGGSSREDVVSLT